MKLTASDYQIWCRVVNSPIDLYFTEDYAGVIIRGSICNDWKLALVIVFTTLTIKRYSDGILWPFTLYFTVCLEPFSKKKISNSLWYYPFMLINSVQLILFLGHQHPHILHQTNTCGSWQIARFWQSIKECLKECFPE